MNFAFFHVWKPQFAQKGMFWWFLALKMAPKTSFQKQLFLMDIA